MTVEGLGNMSNHRRQEMITKGGGKKEKAYIVLCLNRSKLQTGYR